MSDAEWLAVLVTVVGALVVGTWLAVQSDRRRSGAFRDRQSKRNNKGRWRF